MAERDPIKPLTDADGEVRELGGGDFAKAKRLSELPDRLQGKLRKGRGPQKEPTKTLISLRVSPDVLARFRADGEGWQTRMDQALREWIERRDAERS